MSEVPKVHVGWLYDGPNASRLLEVARRCAILVGFVQLLLAALYVWIFADLLQSSVALKPLAYGSASTFVVLQIAVLYFALNLRKCSRAPLWFLAAAYSCGLIVAAVLLLMEQANPNLVPLFVQSSAALPRNEIMGGGWPIALALIAFLLAQSLGLLPLVLVGAVLAASSRRSNGTRPPHC